MKEADEQKLLVQWLRLNKITHFAPINENIHSGIIRNALTKPMASRILGMIENKLKAMGKRSGVNDLVVLLPGAKAVFIEMKREKGGTVSDDQKIWHHEIITLGFECHVCRGFDEAISVIKKVRSA